MAKKVALAVVAVFVCWAVVGFVLHGILLQPSYAASADLWRPMGEMKMGLSYVTTFIYSLVFVLIYALFFGRRGLRVGLGYGCLFGFGAGISMGYGTYAVMPIPYGLALGWFLGTLVEGILAGLIVGTVFKGQSAR